MAQYIYILVNPSLSGMVKIGKTRRSPEERAMELSNSTNMPTSFIVAYEEIVTNCDIAEKHIHGMLTDLGYRVNDGREFFSMPLKYAIQVVSDIAAQVNESIPATEEFDQVDDIDAGTMAEDFLDRGIHALKGSNDSLQDYSAARDYFEKAIACGSALAHLFLANLYITGRGVRQSAEKALEILKKGGEKGSPECYQTMWSIYAGRTVVDVKHEKNAEVCFKWFLEASGESPEIRDLIEYLDQAYDRLNAGVINNRKKLFELEQLPGDHVSEVIDKIIHQIKAELRNIREARLSGISASELKLEKPALIKSAEFNLFQYKFFLSDSTRDPKKHMAKVLDEIEKEDLLYFLPPQQVLEYFPYLTKAKTKKQVENKNDAEETQSEQQNSSGIRSRFMSWFLGKGIETP